VWIIVTVICSSIGIVILVAVILKIRNNLLRPKISQKEEEEAVELKKRVVTGRLDETNEPISPTKLPPIHSKRTSIVGVIIEDPDEQSQSEEEEESESSEEEMTKPKQAYTDPKKTRPQDSTANASIGSIVIDNFPMNARSITPVKPAIDTQKLMPPGILKSALHKRNSSLPDYDVNSQAHRNSSIATNNNQSMDQIEPMRPVTPPKDLWYQDDYKLESDPEMQRKMSKWHMESVEKN
jgi:hypothetical protein